MHEFAMAQDIVETISVKVTEDLEKVSKINIVIGEFSGVVAESLEFGITAIMADKNHPDVNVNIEKIPTIARCQCGNEYQLNDIFDTCPKCHSFNRKLLSGMDVVINSVELLE